MSPARDGRFTRRGSLAGVGCLLFGIYIVQYSYAFSPVNDLIAGLA